MNSHVALHEPCYSLHEPPPFDALVLVILPCSFDDDGSGRRPETGERLYSFLQIARKE